MKNRGQTTIFFSLMVGVLLTFTLTALEAGRIYMARLKARAVAHSACQNRMAEYDRELFERYHLLFVDLTYGTGSEAMAEQQVFADLEESLDSGGRIYRFDVEEVSVAGLDPIFADHMKNLRRQIAEYEKTEGLVRKAAGLKDRLLEKEDSIEEAARETEINAVELPIPDSGDAETGAASQQAAETEGSAAGNAGRADAQKGSQKISSADKTGIKAETGKAGGQKEKQKASSAEKTGKDAGSGTGAASQTPSVEDPRKQLSSCLKNGLLSFVLPGDKSISQESYGFEYPPSEAYKESEEAEEGDAEFGDILALKKLLVRSSGESLGEKLLEHAAFVDYVDSLFSNALNEREDSAIKCEAEYILKGKDSDYDNLQSVLTEITWMRMPVNYAYLLTDLEKKSEALTVATAICTATGTEPLIEVVKYLLLGCWAYGETVCELRDLMSGRKIPYGKDALTWRTDLKQIGAQVEPKDIQSGLDYEDFLMLLLAKKRDQTICYARMLDVMEKNVRRKNPDFHMADCAGGMLLQAKLSVNPLFQVRGGDQAYEICVEDEFHYYGK